jgi:hypothetical protein
MASTTLSITYSSEGNRDKWTWSGWVKRSKLGGHQTLWSRYGDSSNIGDLRFQSDDGFTYQNYSSGSTNAQWNASGKFRDTSAWYHIVFVWDSGNATAADRMKAYVNGEDMAGSASTTPSQDLNSIIGSAAAHKLGSRNSDQYFDGLMSHVHFCDGYAYSPTDFGETDSTTGQWKIKTNPSVSYGTNGYFMFKDDASADDDSGNNNDFTASGTIIPTVDNPSNVFATFNPLDNYLAGGTLANGNTKYTSVSSKHDFAVSTLGMHSGSGKFYAEFKVLQDTDYNIIGISDHSYQGSNQELSEDNYSYGYYNDTSDGKVRANSSNVLTGMPDFGNGDIIGVAVDLENHKLYFSKNGTFINSGDPTSGATGTGAVSIQDLSSVSTGYGQGVYFFAAGLWNTSASGSYSANFGNGYFGTTAISSEGTNASGIGKFEYDVPTGYTALSTKGLNE